MMRLYADNARYRFMFRSDPFHAFYKQKLTEYSSLNEQDGANHNQDPLALSALQRVTESLSLYGKNRANHDDDAAEPGIVLPDLLECRLPKGMTGKDFRTMKLTAQFGAWYGNDFWLGIKDRAGFEFTNPTHSMFPRFTRFVLEYSEVLWPPRDLKEKVSKSDAFMAAIHDGFFCLLDQRDYLQESKWRVGGRKSMIDWHSSLRKNFANEDADEELPPPGNGSEMSPLQPEPKRQKCLVPEDQFLAQHPGWCTIRISVVDVDGSEQYVIERTAQSLAESVASFKEKIAETIRIPPEKQLLFGEAGLLKDNNRSLAHYNVGAGEILTLSLCRCGRENDLDKPCCCRERLDKAFAEMMRSFYSKFN